MPTKKQDFSGDPGALIGDAIWTAIKPLYREGEKARRQRSRLTPKKTYYAPEPKVPQNEIVFSVLPRAIRNAGSHFSRRDLYYATRPLAYAHPDWQEGKELKYPYFSQTLLTDYQELHGTIEGMWTDPRGHFTEPHTGATIGLGTLEVAQYEFPEYAFDKILYVEKEGEMPKFQAAQLAERYDMAIASAKGYPVVAVRELFALAKEGDYQLFVFHDADIDGYSLARVLGEATARMPEHSVEVIDIGLSVEDALEMELESEPFSRKHRIPDTLWERLSGVAKEYFATHSERFELNAILPDTARIEYIKRKLSENGVRGKVIPPEDRLLEMAKEKYRELTAGWVSEAVDELISAEELKRDVADEFISDFALQDSRKYIEDGFSEDDSLSWREALEEKLEAIREQHSDAIRASVEKKLRETL